MPNTALIFSEAGYGHETPEGHPECPERLGAIERGFADAELAPPRIEPKPASREDLLRVHTEEHIETIHGTCLSGSIYEDPDTYMMRGSWPAALLGAGAAIEACKAVLDGSYDNVFSAMRPPGHHAEADRAMGFCLFNNVAVAARWLEAEGGVKRIAILDWDVHHGNGTQYSFYDDPHVHYTSLHQFPHYPGTGRPEERGPHNTNLNLCIPPGASADEWMEAFIDYAIPEIESFTPDFLLVSCGFDAHVLDPLAHQSLQTEHFADMTRRIKHLADGKIVSLLEGGYSLRALAEAGAAHFNALAL